MTQQRKSGSQSQTPNFISLLLQTKSLIGKNDTVFNTVPTGIATASSSGIISKFLITNLPVLVLVSLALLCLFSTDVWAMKADTMKDGLTKLESYLTGNIARGIVIGGCSIAAYRAYSESKFGVLGMAVAGALGLNFLMDFVNATYTCLV